MLYKCGCNPKKNPICKFVCLILRKAGLKIETQTTPTIVQVAQQQQHHQLRLLTIQKGLISTVTNLIEFGLISSHLLWEKERVGENKKILRNRICLAVAVVCLPIQLSHGWLTTKGNSGWLLVGVRVCVWIRMCDTGILGHVQLTLVGKQMLDNVTGSPNNLLYDVCVVIEDGSRERRSIAIVNHTMIVKEREREVREVFCP